MWYLLSFFISYFDCKVKTFESGTWNMCNGFWVLYLSKCTWRIWSRTLQNDTDWLQVCLWKPSDSFISVESSVDFDVMVISFKGVSGKWLRFRPWPLHTLIQQHAAPHHLNNVTLILNCTVSPNKIFCSTFFKTLWVHRVYPIPLEYVSKIVQCHRLVAVFIKLRRVWWWAELFSPPLERYIKPEPQLGASRLQRLFMRPWLSNVKGMTLLPVVL